MDNPGPQFSHGETLRGIENVTSSEKGNFHPTVKPVELMRYLVELVTPPGGLVIDPWMGSDSTGVACIMSGFGFYGMELKYYGIAQRRKAGTFLS